MDVIVAITVAFAGGAGFASAVLIPYRQLRVPRRKPPARRE